MELDSLPSASYSVRTGGSHIPAAILLPTVAFHHAFSVMHLSDTLNVDKITPSCFSPGI